MAFVVHSCPLPTSLKYFFSITDQALGVYSNSRFMEERRKMKLRKGVTHVHDSQTVMGM